MLPESETSSVTGDDGHRLERDRRLVESAADPMYVTDDEGRVDICNDALAALFDRSRESLDGAALAVLLPESGPETLRGALDRRRRPADDLA